MFSSQGFNLGANFKGRKFKALLHFINKRSFVTLPHTIQMVRLVSLTSGTLPDRNRCQLKQGPVQHDSGHPYNVTVDAPDDLPER